MQDMTEARRPRRLAFLDEWVPRAELAQELRVDPRTIQRWASLPDGIRTMMIGGVAHHHVDDIRAWLERSVRVPNPTRKRAAG